MTQTRKKKGENMTVVNTYTTRSINSPNKMATETLKAKAMLLINLSSCGCFRGVLRVKELFCVFLTVYRLNT